MFDFFADGVQHVRGGAYAAEICFIARGGAVTKNFFQIQIRDLFFLNISACKDMADFGNGARIDLQKRRLYPPCLFFRFFFRLRYGFDFVGDERLKVFCESICADGHFHARKTAA